MNSLAPAFDPSGPVATTPFQYPDYEADESSQAHRAVEAIELLEAGLLVVLKGHRDAALTRAAALAVLCGLFSTPSQAAMEIGVAPSTMTRATAALKAALCKSENRKQRNEKRVKRGRPQRITQTARAFLKI